VPTLAASTPDAITLPVQECQATGIAPYATTIFSSATLLFLIQPIIAKEMLPWLGGAAAVWGACMVFFQSLLLLGYLYAHASIRWLGLRVQALVHMVLLAMGAAVLFFLSPAQPNSSTADHPAFAALVFLAARIGLPYFVLSSTSPLIQAWYSRGRSQSLPYRLFALSNLSSLLALVAYPFVVEPNLDLDWQFTAWRWGYAGFAAFCAWIALRSAGYQPASPASAARIAIDSSRQLRPQGNWRRNLRWLALAWCSSALLLGVTNNLCQNIAPMPLMWIAPLAIYLLTFVLCFDHEGWFRVSVYRVLIPCALVGLLWTDANAGLRAYEAIPICLGSLLVACMFCHGQLAALKPAASELTAFYLYLSLGGALGGIFVGLLAPVLFVDLFEVRIAIAACFVLSLRFLFNYRSKVFLFTAGTITVFLFHALMGISARTPTIFRGRSFYGALSVNESQNAAGITVRAMVHGRVIHGGQWLTPIERRLPRYYYGLQSGAGLALERPGSNRRVGIVGLGAGTIATYGQPGDVYRFYEIDPLVTNAANTLFTYLRDSRAQVDVVQGDARLSLDREPAQHFETLILDAFSGDSIPVHLLTGEAFRGYFRHLNEDGVLAVNCSSQYLDLPPVVAEIAATFGRPAMVVDSPDHTDQNISHAIWVLVTRNGAFLDQVRTNHHGEPIPTGRRKPWTDRYSNILAAIR
jgi:hypothetical protein